MDISAKIMKALRDDTELMTLMGGTSAKNSRIYCGRARNATEFPRGIVLELYLVDAVDADNAAGYDEGMYRVTYYSKARNLDKIARRTKAVLESLYPFSVVTLGSDGYESDDNVYSKTVEIELYESKESEEL